MDNRSRKGSKIVKYGDIDVANECRRRLLLALMTLELGIFICSTLSYSILNLLVTIYVYGLPGSP